VADHGRAQFVHHDGLGVINQRRVVVECDDAHLIRREPEREIARVMLNEESIGTFPFAGKNLHQNEDVWTVVNRHFFFPNRFETHALIQPNRR